MSEADRERLRKLLGWFRSGMMVMGAPGATLRARPMVVARIDDDGDVLLATILRSEVHPIESEQQVALTFQFAMACVTVSGPAWVVGDRAVVEAAWNEAMRPWVPGGAEDPALCLIRMRPVMGEYWDMRGMKKIRTLFQAARAYPSGAPRSPSPAPTWPSTP